MCWLGVSKVILVPLLMEVNIPGDSQLQSISFVVLKNHCSSSEPRMFREKPNPENWFVKSSRKDKPTLNIKMSLDLWTRSRWRIHIFNTCVFVIFKTVWADRKSGPTQRRKWSSVNPSSSILYLKIWSWITWESDSVKGMLGTWSAFGH